MSVPAQAREAAERARQMQEGYIQPTPTEANPSEPPNTENQAPATPAPVDWEHRYKTLQGMFNSTVPKLQAELKAATQQIEALKQTAQPAPVTTPVTPRITQTDVDEFGQETIDMMRRAARQEADEALMPVIYQLQSQLASLQTTVVPQMRQMEQEAANNKVNSFVATLDQNIPQWRQLNEDDAFLDWLEVVDPLTGTSRQKLLNSAVDAQDAFRAGAFFQAYIRETGTPPPPPQPAPTPSVNPALEALVAPGRGRGGNPPQEKPTISREYIAAFYRDTAAGKYRDRAAEKSKIEADIFAAQREGRVTN